MADNPVPPSPSGPPAPGTPPSHGELKGALKAFKKKLRSTRLDNESGKISGPLSGGRSSSIVAITPPSQFHQEIWDELVKQGKLKYEGHGTYELVGPLD
ncbi:MAG TPA: hypothetical protein VEK08_05720 [Planctomycetota bacterium]|nr:hypothetical protein [Planctomycetota bacterium]